MLTSAVKDWEDCLSPTDGVALVAPNLAVSSRCFLELIVSFSLENEVIAKLPRPDKLGGWDEEQVNPSHGR